jgi:protein-serine/threonine kinase
VAPQSQTARGEASPPTAPTSSNTRVKEQSPTEVPSTDGYSARPSRSTTGTTATAASRPGREPQRSVSDYTAFGTMPTTSTARPSTGGTLGANSRLPSRGNSYSQPATATVAQTNAEGRFSQPKGKQYTISSPVAQQGSGMGQPSIGQPSAHRMQSMQAEQKGHRRSNTVSETLGRVTSMFSSRQPSYSQDPKESSTTQNSNYMHEKPQKSYPPTSMSGPVANDNAPRQSTESSRRTSFGFSRKTTNDSNNTGKSNRRFSLIPSSLSKTFSSSHRESMPATTHLDRRGSSTALSRPRATSRPGRAFGRGGESRTPSQSTTGSNVAGMYDGPHDSSRSRPGPSSAPANQTQFDHTPPIGDEKIPGPREPHPSTQNPNRPYRHHDNDSEASGPMAQPPSRDHRPQYPQGMGGSEAAHGSHDVPPRKGVLQKSRKFADAYDESAGNKGSTGSSKRVMDFFRRMGRQRGREDR